MRHSNRESLEVSRVALAVALAFRAPTRQLGMPPPRIAGKSSSGFVYQERGDEQTAARANQSTGGFDKIVRSDVIEYQVHDSNAVRFLPPAWERAYHYGLDLHVHYNIGPDGNTYLCPALMKAVFAKIGRELPEHVRDGRCAACDERLRAAEEGEEDFVKALKPSPRCAAYVIDRKEPTKGVLFWSQAASVDKDINGRLQGKKGGVLKIDHPDKGYDVTFKREGEKKKSKYVGIDIEREPSPIFDDETKQAAALDFIVANPIPDVLNFYPYEYIAKQLTGGVTHHDDDETTAAAGNTSTTAATAGERPRIGSTTAAAAEPAKSSRPSIGAAAAAAPPVDDAKPTWAEAHELPIDDLYGFAEEMKIEFPADREFKSEDEVRDFVCEEAGIENPDAAPAATPTAAEPAATGSWRDRLRNRGK